MTHTTEFTSGLVRHQPQLKDAITQEVKVHANLVKAAGLVLA